MKNQLGLAILKISIATEQDIVTARQKTRSLAQFFGFENQDQARLATAVSELSRNVYQYATTGFVEFFFKDSGEFSVCVSDTGPGIPHIQDILNGMYVSKTGLGVGLLGAKKLMDSFSIDTNVNDGTTIVISKILEKPKPIAQSDLDMLTAQLAVTKQTEGAFEEIQVQNRELVRALEEVKAAKSELAELNRELAETNRGVVALYSELDERAASLQRANIVKTSFLSNMTHEFRTPLSSIISLTRILTSRIDGPLTSEQEKQVGYIRKSSEDLLELVNDLLDLAKVEAGKVSINASSFLVDEVLGALRGVFRPLVTSPYLELMIEEPKIPFCMVSDMAKISQILRNLLSNAIKFTEAGTVRLQVFADDGDSIHFVVEDSGHGIAPEHCETIFEDFNQITTKHHKAHKGTGLGLPLSRKLAQLLSGRLWVESEIGIGSMFHLLLPRVHKGEAEAILITDGGAVPKAHSEYVPGSNKFRVLVIDDHEPSRYVLKSLINSQIEADFLETADGQTGLNQVRHWKPDVVFLDLNMPGFDGFEVLEEFKADGEISAIPIIINTARKLSDEERRQLESQATAVVSKDSVDDRHASQQIRDALTKAGFDYKQKDICL